MILKMSNMWMVLFFIQFLYEWNISSAFDEDHKDYVPMSVRLTSQFIQEFREKFEDNSLYRFSQPYLTSISDEIINLDIMKSISLLLEELENESQSKKKDNDNTTLNATAPVAQTINKHMANCYAYDYNGSPRIEIVNQQELIGILKSDPVIANRSSPGACAAMIVFAYTCPFCAMAAAHLNALPRAFPQIRMVAIDSRLHQSLNSQYGIVGVPTMMLFHNGRPIAKFNRSEYTLSEFSHFLTYFTGIRANEKMYVASVDFGGPLKSIPAVETDYHLIVAWIFLVSIVIARFFTRLLY